MIGVGNSNDQIDRSTRHVQSEGAGSDWQERDSNAGIPADYFGGWSGYVIFKNQQGKRVKVTGTPDVHVIVDLNAGTVAYGNSANIDQWLTNFEIYRTSDLSVGALIVGSTP